MELARCLGYAPLAVLVAAGTLGLARPPAIAGAAPWAPAPCTGTATRPPGRPLLARSTWFRLEPVLDASGTLAGQRLIVGAGGRVRSLALPPESFASGSGGMILVGADDGAGSVLRVLDAARGCTMTLATEPSVVRSAVRASDGSILEHRVDRTTRADLGVWRRPRGGGPAGRILPALPADPAFGPTFTTQLLAADGGGVVVASCGEQACRTRVLDGVGGWIGEVDGTGPVLGLANGRLVVRDACGGWPCAVLSVDPAHPADRRTIVTAAVHAALDVMGRLVYESPDGSTHTLDLAGAAR
ncbi:MAG: hypothetical protein WCK58_18465 [Chloroflexota bacterium]